MKLKYYWKRFCQMAITEVDSKNRIYILVYFAIISLLEMIAYIKKGIFSVVAFRIWLYMIACAEEVIDNKSEREINIVVITDNLLQSNIYDYATFFYPSAYTCSIMSNDTMPEMDRNRDTFVFSESKEALVRCNIDVQSKIFENPRYNTVHIWYYGEIE